MPTHTPLWWNPDRMEAVRQALAEGDPTLKFFETQTRARTSGGEEEGCHGMEPRAVVAWLDGDRDEASRLLATWRELAAVKPTSNLGEAGWALSGAALLDVLDTLVEPDAREATARVLWNLVAKLRVPTKGNPHVVTNNWWAVTHGAALCAALAAERASTPSTPGRDPDAVAWAYGRLRAFCSHFGPTGLYHEGLGYIRYTSIFVFSAAMAARSQGVGDLLAEFPNLAQMVPSLYTATIAREYVDDTHGASPKSGVSLSWNDMGMGAGVSAVDHIGLSLAPRDLQPALCAWFDRAFGRKAAHPTIGGHHANVPMAWAFHPFGLPDADPATLPTRVHDTRQGLLFARNRWRDANDIVFGLYTKATHGGGHAHSDAGSIRLEAFGQSWIAGPGQARTRPEGQSIVWPGDALEAKRQNNAYLNFHEDLPTGLRVSVDLRKSSGAYHERLLALDWSPPGQTKLAMLLMDHVDDHLDTRAWNWSWTHGREIQGEIESDGLGFILRAESGGTLRLRFLGAKPETLEISALPSSQRTYSGGNTETYAGKPVLQARFAPAKHLSILVAAVWSDGEPAELSGDIEALTINGEPWTRPFGAMLPRSFQPGASPGPSQFSANGLPETNCR